MPHTFTNKQHIRAHKHDGFIKLSNELATGIHTLLPNTFLTNVLYECVC